MRVLLSIVHMIGYAGCFGMVMLTRYDFVKADPQLFKTLETHIGVARTLQATPLFWLMALLLAGSWLIDYAIRHKARKRSEETMQRWYREPLR